MQKVDEYKLLLKQLLNREISPATVVGKGYKNPRRTASAWLRQQLHNLENPNSRIAFIGVASTGKAYASEAKAMKSADYQALAAGNFKLLTDALIVVDYGVMPGPGDDGYVVYACTAKKETA
ncbi:hypothetical protein TUM3794_20450 [Shewanella colwelliana]|uniref:Uncharacterized protein n=1 Tax=Shewanella colwelliana TaxID=23 RepID=A0ABQ4P0T1_SHECO|nr:hypothetical protein [Shewanella colwelliana]GIU41025.1 hypothetical protein TUM3794_20450 [Shewanella colwelliana]